MQSAAWSGDAWRGTARQSKGSQRKGSVTAPFLFYTSRLSTFFPSGDRLEAAPQYFLKVVYLLPGFQFRKHVVNLMVAGQEYCFAVVQNAVGTVFSEGFPLAFGAFLFLFACKSKVRFILNSDFFIGHCQKQRVFRTQVVLLAEPIPKAPGFHFRHCRDCLWIERCPGSRPPPARRPTVRIHRYRRIGSGD